MSAPVRTVQQEGRARLGEPEHVDAIEEAELVAGDEVGAADEVRRVDRRRIEAEVRDRHRPGLLRVVDEVALHVQVGVLTDDLGRVLVGADGAVRAESVEHGPQRGVVGHEVGVDREAGMA